MRLFFTEKKQKIRVSELFREFLELEIRKRINYDFCRPASQEIILFQTLIQCWHSFLEPQINQIGSWLGWKTFYVESIYMEFLELKIWKRIDYFFCRAVKSKFLWLSDCFLMLTLLLSPFNQLNNFLTRLKDNLCSNTIEGFWSSKFDNVSTTFVDQLGQIFILSQTRLQKLHSSSEPQIKWIRLWLCWKTFYVSIIYWEFLELRIRQRVDYFFVYQRSQKFICFRTLF